MKILHSLPKDKAFFDNYAPLIKAVTLAGIFAQVVSGLTEIGIIYTGTAQSLQPLALAWFGMVLSIAVAAIATATIEVGLRQALPKAVDSILFKRWNGLHLPISIFVWLLVVVLMGASGYLSFKNSTVIVEGFTPEPEQQTTTATDSTYNAQTADLRASFVQDSAMIATAYESRTAATVAAYDGQIRAKEEKLRGYESRETRTGKSFASAKDKVRQERAELEAERAGALATLATDKAKEMATAKDNYRASLTTATAAREASTTEIKTANRQAESERAATVAGYGGGLGWFTVVCLFIFTVSVILDRIYRKGAGITESIQIGAFDFRPGAIAEAIAAARERVNQALHSRITAFANRTPAAPLPPQPGAVFDLVEALQHVTIKLELDKGGEPGRVMYLNSKEPPQLAQPPKQQQQIGYRHFGTSQPTNSPPATTNLPTNQAQGISTNPAPTTNTGNSVYAQGTPCAVKATPENINLADALQRLKMYKKRLGSHQQKAKAQERKDGKVCKRTAEAIANNREWVGHWEAVIINLQNGNK
jgi:hypothetical protein